MTTTNKEDGILNAIASKRSKIRGRYISHDVVWGGKAGINIRRLRKSEIKEASAIVGRNYSRKWQRTSRRELSDMFGDASVKPIYVVAKKSNKVLGFTGYIQSWMDYDVYEVFWVNVVPEYQRQGIGTALMKKVIEEIKRKKDAKLILLSATPKNVPYYTKVFGFRVIRPSSKGYYLMGLDKF